MQKKGKIKKQKFYLNVRKIKSSDVLTILEMCEDVRNSRKMAENLTLNVRKNGEKQRNNSKKHVKKMLTG